MYQFIQVSHSGIVIRNDLICVKTAVLSRPVPVSTYSFLIFRITFIKFYEYQIQEFQQFYHYLISLTLRNHEKFYSMAFIKDTYWFVGIKKETEKILLHFRLQKNVNEMIKERIRI